MQLVAMQGNIPTFQQHVIVFPRVEKAGADPADVKNYRPVSNHAFMSKIVERLVCRQLISFLNRYKRPGKILHC